MQVFRGISFVVAIIATIMMILFVVTAPLAVDSVEPPSKDFDDNEYYQEGLANLGYGLERGLVAIAYLVMSLISSAVACVASIAPSFSYNLFIKITSRVLLTVHGVIVIVFLFNILI